MEILLASILLSLVAMGAFAIYGSSQTYLRDSMTQGRLQSDTAFALRHIARNVRRASAVTPDNATGGFRLTIPSTTTSVTMLYWIPAGTQLLRWDNDLAVAGGEQTLADRVTTLAVTDASLAPMTAASTSLAITLTSTAGGQAFTLSTTTTLRGRQT